MFKLQWGILKVCMHLSALYPRYSKRIKFYCQYHAQLHSWFRLKPYNKSGPNYKPSVMLTVLIISKHVFDAQNITTLKCMESSRIITRRRSRGLDSCHMLERDKYSSINSLCSVMIMNVPDQHLDYLVSNETFLVQWAREQ